MLIHQLFDLLALFLAIMGNIFFRKQFQLKIPSSLPDKHRYTYMLLLIMGMVFGSLLAGSFNLYLSGTLGIAKSLLGGIAGAVLIAEVFKFFAGIKGSTGFYYLPGLCILIIVGRIGCFLAGIDDYTYGIATTLPWGVDFGDTIKRHPVQLYESFAMLLFFLALIFSYKKNQSLWVKHGFYFFILWYAGQRFIWEFLKPYATLIGPLNLFHLLAIAMIIYAISMLRKKELYYA